MNTLNWRIRHLNPSNFFVEADLPDAEKNGHFPRVEVMMEDFGDHNGYTEEIRLADAKLIVAAPKMKAAIDRVIALLNTIDNKGRLRKEPTELKILEILTESIEDLQ